MPLLSTPSDTRSLTSVLLAENACDENPVLARVVVLSALRSSTFMRVLALALPFAWTPACAVANRRDSLPTETGRVDVKGAPPGPQMLEPPRYAELPVPANLVESRPSTLSAFSLATFLSELTVMGCSPGSTCNARAGPAPSLSILSMALVALPMRLVILLTLLTWPRLKVAPTPVPASAVVTTPNKRARITARPTRNTVALPTYITLLAMLLIMVL